MGAATEPAIRRSGRAALLLLLCAVLLLNLAVPLIDRYTVPRIYGRGH